MKARNAVLALVVGVVSSVGSGTASAGFVNGNFATGDLTGWTASAIDQNGNSGDAADLGRDFRRRELRGLRYRELCHRPLRLDPLPILPGHGRTTDSELRLQPACPR